MPSLQFTDNGERSFALDYAGIHAIDFSGGIGWCEC